MASPWPHSPPPLPFSSPCSYVTGPFLTAPGTLSYRILVYLPSSMDQAWPPPIHSLITQADTKLVQSILRPLSRSPISFVVAKPNLPSTFATRRLSCEPARHRRPAAQYGYPTDPRSRSGALPRSPRPIEP